MAVSADVMAAATALADSVTNSTIDWGMENKKEFATYLFSTSYTDRKAAQRSYLNYMAKRLLNDSEMMSKVYGMVTMQASEKLGVTLDPEDPFSPASLTAAISGRVGIPLTNITDKEALKSDVLRYGAGIAAAKTGLHLDPADPFGKASITNAIAAASGVPLTDITNKEQIKADLMAFGKAQMAAEIGERVNGKLAALVAQPAVQQMEKMVQLANSERSLLGMPELKKDQIAQRMNAVNALVRSAAIDEVSNYEAKVCVWNKAIAKRGAQVIASRKYREGMKQAGFSKKWARNGVIKGDV